MSTMRPRRAWWILLAMGVLALAGATFLAFSPGFRVAPPVAFGSTMQVELAPGDHAAYVTPSDQRGAIDCSGALADGSELRLRPDMTQQGLIVPRAWDARGSFATRTLGTVTLTCDGPVADAEFTVGPVQSFFDLAGAVLAALAAAVLLVIGLVLRAAGRRRPGA